MCIYCSDALEALETQAAHPRVTVATTSALLNVFVQGMLAKVRGGEEGEVERGGRGGRGRREEDGNSV